MDNLISMRATITRAVVHALAFNESSTNGVNGVDEIDTSHIVRQQAEQTAITSLIDRLQLLDRFTVRTLASSLSDFIVCVTCTHSLPWEGIIGYKYGAKVVKSYEMSKKKREYFAIFVNMV